MSYDYLFKVIVLGDSGVGKSCLLLQFTDKQYHGLHDVTIGVEFQAKNVIIDNKTIKLQIWDTAGQESFQSITRSYYRGASCVLLLYDVSKRDSFRHVSHWINEARIAAGPNLVIILVGNKCDLDRREVTYAEGLEYAYRNDLIFVETSARTAVNVDEAFTLCAARVYKLVMDGVINVNDETSGVKLGNIDPIRSKLGRRNICC